MIELFSLIKGLNSSEYQVVKNFFTRNKKDSDSHLTEKLFNSIYERPQKELSDIQLSQLLYKEKKEHAIAKVKSRLFQQIIEALGSDNSLLRDDIFDASDKQELRTRKKMYYFRVLHRKKNKADHIILVHLLNEVIKEAREFELFELVLEALRHKQLFLKLRKGSKELAELEQQIAFYTYCYDALIRTYEIYYDLLNNINHIQKRSLKQICADFKSDFDEIADYVKKTDSGFITYMYKMIQLDQFQREKKHSDSIDICLELISLLKAKPFLYRNERMGNIYDNISQCQVYNNNFSEAIKSVQKAQTFYSKDTRSYIASKEQEFHSFFYSGDYSKALTLIETALDSRLDNVGEFTADRFLFFKSCSYLGLGRFQDSINICNEALELTKDKGRWDIGIRYIRLLNIIALENDQLADDAIEALRRSFGRNVKNGFVSSRDKLILKAFQEYCRIGFGSQPSRNLSELVSELSSAEQELSWEYYTHELFPIHEWILSRLEPVRVAGLKKKK